MSERMTDRELMEAVAAHFDRAITPFRAAAIAERARAGDRQRAPNLDVARVAFVVAIGALLLFAGYQAVRFVGALLERDPEPAPASSAGMIAVVNGGQIQLLDDRNGTVLRTIDADGSAPFCPTLAPDGSTLTYYSGLGDIMVRLVPLDGRRAVQLSDPIGSDSAPPSWSRDGRLFVVVHTTTDPPGGIGGEVWLYESDGTPLRELGRSGRFLHASISPDGELVAILDDGTLRVVRSDGSGTLATVQHPQRTASAQVPDWSPDGREIVYALGPGNGRTVFVYNVEMGQDRVLNSTDEGYFPRWSPRGDAIAVNPIRGLNKLALLDAEHGELTLFDIHIPFLASHSWSPDGKSLAVLLSKPASGHELVVLSTTGTIQLRTTLGTQMPAGDVACPVAWSLRPNSLDALPSATDADQPIR